MSVIVTMLGRLGNNLFQYGLGRIIAEHHGLAFECIPAAVDPTFNFLGRSVDSGPLVTLADLTASFPHAPMRLPGTVVEHPVEQYEIKPVAPDSEWLGHDLDLPRLLADPTPRQIRLAGYFHRAEYFVPYRDRLRTWFRPRSIPMPFAIHPRDVVLNIRRGFDFGILQWTLSLSYYHRILERMRDVGQVYVCGTCIDAQVQRGLARYDPIYYDATPIEHFNFLTRFNRLVISNSTFAWWAAFLSDATEIYGPPTGIDLNMRDARYIEVADVEMARFAPFSVTPSARAANVSETLDAESAELLRWMLKQNRPVALSDVMHTYRSPELLTWMMEHGLTLTPEDLMRPGKPLDLSAAFRRLMEAGLVTQDTRYVEEA
jgi:Glycosyl transferase family 11